MFVLIVGIFEAITIVSKAEKMSRSRTVNSVHKWEQQPWPDASSFACSHSEDPVPFLLVLASLSWSHWSSLPHVVFDRNLDHRLG